MYNESQVAARALKAGANGFITKDSNPDKLVAAIQKIVISGRYIDPILAEALAFESLSSDSQTKLNNLSNRELQILGLLASGKSINNIADLLSLSHKTVSTYKSRLMDKLQLTNMVELVHFSIANSVL